LRDRRRPDLMKLRRRFVNVVAESYLNNVCSLHRLDVSQHLFYPSTAEAEAAAKPEVFRLSLPAPAYKFQPAVRGMTPERHFSVWRTPGSARAGSSGEARRGTPSSSTPTRTPPGRCPAASATWVKAPSSSPSPTPMPLGKQRTSTSCPPTVTLPQLPGAQIRPLQAKIPKPSNLSIMGMGTSSAAAAVRELLHPQPRGARRRPHHMRVGLVPPLSAAPTCLTR